MGKGKSMVPISLDDPRSQVPPYRYDLYAVTNHFGTLSSGHCEYPFFAYYISPPITNVDGGEFKSLEAIDSLFFFDYRYGVH